MIDWDTSSHRKNQTLLNLTLPTLLAARYTWSTAYTAGVGEGIAVSIHVLHAVSTMNLPPGMSTMAATKKKMKPLIISSDVVWRTISNTNPTTIQAKEDGVDKRTLHDNLLAPFPGHH